jgi:hypothetical protein
MVCWNSKVRGLRNVMILMERKNVFELTQPVWTHSQREQKSVICKNVCIVYGQEMNAALDHRIQIACLFHFINFLYLYLCISQQLAAKANTLQPSVRQAVEHSAVIICAQHNDAVIVCYFSLQSSNLFSNTLSLCSSLSVTDQVSHPNRTSGIIIVCIFNYYIFRRADENAKGCGVSGSKHYPNSVS